MSTRSPILDGIASSASSRPTGIQSTVDPFTRIKMAEVKKNVSHPVVPPPTYTLELSQSEAVALYELFYGGLGGGVITILGLEDLYRKLAKEVDFERIRNVTW